MLVYIRVSWVGSRYSTKRSTWCGAVCGVVARLLLFNKVVTAELLQSAENAHRTRHCTALNNTYHCISRKVHMTHFLTLQLYSITETIRKKITFANYI